MPDNRNRKRPIQVKFFVDEKELAAIKQRMIESGTDNLSAYLFVDEKELAAIKQRMIESGTDNLSAYLRTMAMEGTFPTADCEKSFKQEKTQKS